MARKQYSLPISRTAGVAAAPARLAEEYGSRALWRARLDGELEVATVRDGYLYRRLVNENGTTTLIDSAPPPPGYRWSFPTVCAGFAVCMAALIGVAIHGRLEFVAPRPAFLPFIVGMAVMGIGWLPVFFAEAVEQRVKHLSSWMSVWHEATQLNGWAPRTSAQRAAVERLANDHDGIAQVRDVGTATVDVLVTGLVPSQVVPGRPSRTHRVGGIDATGQEGHSSPGGRGPTKEPEPDPG